MTILITGAAGFIGFHTAQKLLNEGEQIIGIDNLNDYYDPALKLARLAQLEDEKGFEFIQADLAEKDQIQSALASKKITKIIHLAAQAGVRYSIENPDAYVRSNLVGHMNILEYARNLDSLEHLIYASSSSVYGGTKTMPFSEDLNVNKPVSLYAATKKSNELLSYSYSHLYGIPQCGLRFFTVYGPWGRPDMAYWTFTKKILAGTSIPVFNNGDMLRDFTYIDDIVDGITSIANKGFVGEGVPHSVYNIGNNKPEKLIYFIETLEKMLGKKSVREYLPMQMGDVPATYADISAISKDYGFEPKTDLASGLEKFVRWYRSYTNQ